MERRSHLLFLGGGGVVQYPGVIKQKSPGPGCSKAE